MAIMRASTPYGEMSFPSDDIGESTAFVVEHGQCPEIHTLNAIVRNLSPDGIFLDIGAHVGLFSLAAAQVCRAVLAFEPQPALFTVLSDNAARLGDGRVRCFRSVVSDRGGVSFSLPDTPIGRRFSYGSVELGREQSEPLGVAMTYGRGYSAGSVRIDDLALPPGRIEAIKIDVEGMEARVLEGARLTIAEHRPFLAVEWMKNDVAALERLLRELGYPSPQKCGLNLLCRPSVSSGSASGRHAETCER